MKTDRSKGAVAAEAWQRLFSFFIGTVPQRTRVLGRLGLTPNDSRALGSLDAQHGRTMSSLAKEWACDASNVTWIVERLERQGFVVRRTEPADRRVKRVLLTPLGVKTKDELVRGMNEPPPELLELDLTDLEALLAAALKLPVDTRPAPPFQPPQ